MSVDREWVEVFLLVVVFTSGMVIAHYFILTPSTSGEVPNKPNYEATAKVRKVFDGDTIEVEILEVKDPHEGVKPGEEKLRFAGIDAEETHQEDAVEKHGDVKGMSQTEYEETRYYKHAKSAKGLVKSLAPEGENVFLDFDDLAYGKEPYRGYYGRLLAVVYVKENGGWTNVNAEVLNQEYPEYIQLTTGFKSEFAPRSWLEKS